MPIFILLFVLLPESWEKEEVRSMEKRARLKIKTVLPEKVLGKANSYDFVIPYAGRWVVIVDNRVVADGETARDATSSIPPKTKLGKSLLFKVPAEPDKLLVV